MSAADDAGRVITAVTSELTPSQARRAAARVSKLEGDVIARRFFARVAGTLEVYANDTERDICRMFAEELRE